MNARPSTRTHTITLAAGMAAAVFIGTFLVRVPIPATNGYVNLGDPFIVLSGLLFGPMVGAVAGGFGSAVADLIGFPVFALPSLLVKGAAGFVVGVIGHNRTGGRVVLAAVAGEAVVVIGYFAIEAFVFRASMGMPAALTELPFNLVQAGAGATLGLTAWFALRRKPAGAEMTPRDGDGHE